MGIIVFTVFYTFIFFHLVRILLKLVFKPLTARWIALGLSISYVLGLFLLQLVTPHEIFLDALQEGQSIVFDATMSWLVALIPLNLMVLPGLYWWDKRIAQKLGDEGVRIPENALHALAFSGGLLGAFIGQKAFHHKISKRSFQIKHYLICGLSLAIYCYLGYRFFYSSDFLIS